MRCRHHPDCPGCPLLDLDAAAQLDRKRQRLAAAFRLYPHLPAVPPVLGSAWTEGYRHRLKLPVVVGRDHVRIGLYDRQGRDVLDTPDCPVLAPPLRDALVRLAGWLRGRDGVHAVDLRVSHATGQLQLVLACAGGHLPGAPGQLLALGFHSVAVSRADPEGKRVLGQDARVVAGVPYLEERIGATRYHLLPGAFFQTDPRQAERLHGLVRDAVGDARRIVDLYAGVGGYGLALAEGRTKVVLVEELRQAAQAARDVAPPNVQVVCGRVEALDRLEPADVVILNPARRGSDPSTLARVARAAPRVVYVSCGPETLARDLDALAAFGMRVGAVQPIDLFPQTAEVETVVTLARGPRLESWAVPGGRATGPWLDAPSGALGRPGRVLALVVGDPGPVGEVGGARFRRLGLVAGHALLRLELAGPLVPALAQLARRGHPVAGRDPRTRRFFSEKAGLQRAFVHIEAAGRATAPLHGDLVQVLLQLGAPDSLVRRAGGPAGAGFSPG